MNRVLVGVAVVGFVFAMSTSMYAQAAQGRQGGGGGRGFTNLRVLPSDIEPARLIELMQGAEAALGVDCSHCHVFNGRGAPGNDMASDEKAPKQVARVMMAMTREINERLRAEVGKPADQVTAVTCMTCHRGSTIPTIAAAAAN